MWNESCDELKYSVLTMLSPEMQTLMSIKSFISVPLFKLCLVCVMREYDLEMPKVHCVKPFRVILRMAGR